MRWSRPSSRGCGTVSVVVGRGAGVTSSRLAESPSKRVLDSPWLLSRHSLVVDADADASTFVIDIDGEEKRVRSDHVTPAPRPTTTDTVPHPLPDRLGQRKPPTATADEYMIDKLLGLRQTGDSCSAKVRWFYYGSKDDTWEPLENLPRNLVVRFLRQKKKHVPRYEWQTPTRRSRRQGRKKETCICRSIRRLAQSSSGRSCRELLTNPSHERCKNSILESVE